MCKLNYLNFIITNYKFALINTWWSTYGKLTLIVVNNDMKKSKLVLQNNFCQ